MTSSKYLVSLYLSVLYLSTRLSPNQASTSLRALLRLHLPTLPLPLYSTQRLPPLPLNIRYHTVQLPTLPFFFLPFLE